MRKISDKSTVLNLTRTYAALTPLVERIFQVAAMTPELQNARGSMYAWGVDGETIVVHWEEFTPYSSGTFRFPVDCLYREGRIERMIEQAITEAHRRAERQKAIAGGEP